MIITERIVWEVTQAGLFRFPRSREHITAVKPTGAWAWNLNWTLTRLHSAAKVKGCVWLRENFTAVKQRARLMLPMTGLKCRTCRHALALSHLGCDCLWQPRQRALGGACLQQP